MILKKTAILITFIRIFALFLICCYFFGLSFLLLGIFSVIFMLCCVYICELNLKIGEEIVIRRGILFRKIYRFKKKNIRAVAVIKSPLETLFGVVTVKVYLKGFTVFIPFFNAKELKLWL